MIAVVAVVAVVLLCAGLLYALGGGSRDERSYEAGRQAGAASSVVVRYGSADPEEHCKGQYTLKSMTDDDLSRRDFVEGCLDALGQAAR